MGNKLFTVNGSIVRGLIALIIGLLFVLLPNVSLKTIVLGVGILILIAFIISLVLALKTSEKGEKNFLIIQASFDLLIGLIFLFFPSTIVKIFFILVGLGLLIMGIIHLSNVFYLRTRLGWQWFSLFVSILTIFAGIFMLFEPFNTAKAILIFSGVFLLLYGLGELYMAWKMNKEANITVTEQNQ